MVMRFFPLCGRGEVKCLKDPSADIDVTGSSLMMTDALGSVRPIISNMLEMRIILTSKKTSVSFSRNDLLIKVNLFGSLSGLDLLSAAMAVTRPVVSTLSQTGSGISGFPESFFADVL